jgi:hypothetical protein
VGGFGVYGVCGLVVVMIIWDLDKGFGGSDIECP